MMMVKRAFAIATALTLGMVVGSAAQAQGYSAQRSDYSGASRDVYPPPQPLPGFDSPQDEADYNQPQNTAALPSQSAQQLGPVMSPDDPRYGRPMAPSANYAQPGRGTSSDYADRSQGNSGYIYRDGGMRPPQAVDGQQGYQPQGGYQQSSYSQPQGGPSPTQLSALPEDDQPEAGGTEKDLPPNLRRQEVNFVTKEPPGTIVVDTPNTYLYYVLGGGRAIRYGVRVGREGFTWTGVQKITRKAEWPDWHPPAEMIERQPYLPRFMAGGDGNPLGARAMYLGSTVYRIHGTNQPSTIGKFVSSGCVGMLNEDVTDLFDRVKVGTRVVVLPGNPPASTPVASASQTAPPQQASVQQNYSTPGAATSVQPLPPPVSIR
jgi:lipoprotein-anchoring transpeptidase ErfK/SrfK